MNINEIYACPNCKKNGKIVNVVPLMSDTRFDIVQCEECGCAWRVYYKMAECRAEVVKEPVKVDAPAETTDAPNPAKTYEFNGETVEPEVCDTVKVTEG